MINFGDIASQSGVYGALASGIYATVVYFIMIHFVSAKRHLSWIGIRNRWLAFVLLLYFFGFSKHEIGYYLTVESNYCKQTSICKTLLNKKQPTIVDKIKHTFGFVENVWLEAAGEGLVFILVGVPLFLFVRPQLAAAFLTGLIAHIIAKHSGMHDYFCRSSCSPDPLAKNDDSSNT